MERQQAERVSHRAVKARTSRRQFHPLHITHAVFTVDTELCDCWAGTRVKRLPNDASTSFQARSEQFCCRRTSQNNSTEINSAFCHTHYLLCGVRSRRLARQPSDPWNSRQTVKVHWPISDGCYIVCVWLPRHAGLAGGAADDAAAGQCYFYTPNTPSFHSTFPKQQGRTPPWSITGYADYSIGFDSGRVCIQLDCGCRQEMNTIAVTTLQCSIACG
jgi:hypothetical protein